MSGLTKEEIRSKIAEWEDRADEAFLDYWDDQSGGLSFMTWCLSKGYISAEKFELWKKACEEDPWLAKDTQHFVHADHPWSVIITPGEANDEVYEQDVKKSLLLVAEFIASSQDQQDKFEAFLAESLDEEDD